MRWAVAIACVVACGNREEVGKPAGSGAPGSAAAPGSAVAGSGAGSAAVAAVADAGPAPLSPKIKAARCSEACLFLVDTPLAKLPETFKTECAGMTTPDVGFDDCKQLDFARNCIYAAHGVVYTKPRWKTLFATKPWYQPDPAADPKTALSDVERANVHELHERGKACKKGLNISGADYDRLKAWFSAWPRGPALPKTLFADTDPVDAKTFVTAMHTALGAGKLSLGGKVTAIYYSDLHYTGADYPADDAPVALVDAIGAPASTKLRGIRVGFPAAEQHAGEWTGTYVNLIYDDADHLLGVQVTGYVYADGD